MRMKMSDLAAYDYHPPPRPASNPWLLRLTLQWRRASGQHCEWMLGILSMSHLFGTTTTTISSFWQQYAPSTLLMWHAWHTLHFAHSRLWNRKSVKTKCFPSMTRVVKMGGCHREWLTPEGQSGWLVRAHLSRKWMIFKLCYTYNT